MFVTDALNCFSGGYLFQEKGYTSGETLVKELFQHSPCKTLIEEAQNTIRELGLGALEIRLESTKNGFPAEQDKNIIRISPKLSASEQRGYAIMELTNLLQHRKHSETWRAAIKGVYKSAEDYARAVEFIEYDGVKRWNAVTRAVNKQHGRFFRPYMANEWEKISVENMDFNLYYSRYLADNHKEYHRKNWESVHKRTEFINNVFKIALGILVTAIACLKWGVQKCGTTPLVTEDSL